MTVFLDRRGFVLGLGTVPLAAGWARANIDIVIAGNVETQVGVASGLFNGATRTLSPGADVFIDDMLRTNAGARLAVMLGEKTRLSLGERTRVKIDRFIADQGGDLVLERGAMLFDRPDDEKHGPLSVSTPFGLILARGTRFFVGPSQGAVGVFVERGLVDVRNRGGAVTLTPGLGTSIVSMTTAPTPAKPWSDERIASAMASVS